MLGPSFSDPQHFAPGYPQPLEELKGAYSTNIEKHAVPVRIKTTLTYHDPNNHNNIVQLSETKMAVNRALEDEESKKKKK